MVGEIRIRLPFLSNAWGTEESARHMSNQISVVPLWLRGATFLLHAKKRNFPSFSFSPSTSHRLANKDPIHRRTHSPHIPVFGSSEEEGQFLSVWRRKKVTCLNYLQWELVERLFQVAKQQNQAANELPNTEKQKHNSFYFPLFRVGHDCAKRCNFCSEAKMKVSSLRKRKREGAWWRDDRVGGEGFSRSIWQGHHHPPPILPQRNRRKKNPLLNNWVSPLWAVH